MITVWHYPGCDTCRRALKWLDARGIPHHRVHILEQPPSVRVLRALVASSGLPLSRFFNTSGQSYRKGGFKDRLPNMTEDEALAVLAADGKLVKRPLVDAGDRALVGFDEAAWSAVLG